MTRNAKSAFSGPGSLGRQHVTAPQQVRHGLLTHARLACERRLAARYGNRVSESLNGRESLPVVHTGSLLRAICRINKLFVTIPVTIPL